jgi:hypothetical protein
MSMADPSYVIICHIFLRPIQIISKMATTGFYNSNKKVISPVLFQNVLIIIKGRRYNWPGLEGNAQSGSIPLSMRHTSAQQTI